jgi:nucleoside-diphosphate-sugar epimerase
MHFCVRRSSLTYNSFHDLFRHNQQGKIGTVLGKAFQKDYCLRLFIGEHELKFKPPIDAEVVKVNLSDEKDLHGKFRDLDVVVHLAALSDPHAEWADVRKHNIDASINVWNECVNSKVRRIVFASTNHVQHADFWDSSSKSTESADYSKLQREREHLRDVPFPDDFYGLTKLFGEDLGKLYAAKHDLECVAVRIGWLESDEKGKHPC